MFHKIMKRGRKPQKLDANEPAVNPYSHRGPGNPNVVTINHSSLASTSDPSSGSAQQQREGPSSDRCRNSYTCTSAPPDEDAMEYANAVLPLFRDVPASDRHALLLRKLRVCSIIFDFSDTLKHPREKEVKRLALVELIDLIKDYTSSNGNTGSSWTNSHNNAILAEPAAQEGLIRMISINIFRPMPPACYENTGNEFTDPEEEDPYFEPAWPHLQIVYEILLRYVASPDTDTRIAKRYVDHSFLMGILDLFNSEDAREREYLKALLHRIYARFMAHRPFIRKAIGDIFYRFIFETERHSGIAELLDILASIIAGFTVPMKEEHKRFLSRALIPLHKPKSVGLYHQQLSVCIIQFVDKDYKLADTVIRGILKYWPLTNCQKEVMFLSELEDVLQLTQPAEFHKCMVPLFRRVARCLNSPHFQVAERSLFLWNNDNVVSLIAQNRKVILPIIYESLEKNMHGHWNQAVHGLTGNVRKMFLDMDSELFEECQQKYADKEFSARKIKQQRELKWKKLEEVAAEKAQMEDMVLAD